ncbi:putative golgin subfamily A member 6-like protein 3 [Sander lucioperca]|uniref:Putative golgin subfamily A member 6-like protein 3 n=1 Tax=Sander lucioperca TaxID=283035 RepID=A0A8D0ACI7_SANLU|nr:putative golgin subfamily A member 6-like protein 3 [Sander lucioperca]
MEDDNISSTGFEPLFIKEEDADPDRTLMEQSECNTAQSGLTFTGTQLNQSALIKPYLQEMDNLLTSCEKRTGIPFGSHFSATYNETSLTESTHSHTKEEDAMESCGETSISPQAYLSTSYIDVHMDGAGTENQPTQGQSQDLGPIITRCGASTEASHQNTMPLTSAGNKLSDTMVEYEGQLLGMLAMLESCMEESGMDFEPQGWPTDASQEYVHISKTPHLYRGTTLVPVQQGRPMKLETQPMQLESWAGRHAGGEEVPKESRNKETLGSATNGSQQNPMPSLDNMGGFSIKTLESQDQVGLDSEFRFPGPSMPLYSTENDPMYCEATKTRYMSTNEGANTKDDVTKIEIDNTELPAKERQELKMETIDLGSYMNELGALGSHMEECIEEVERLEKRRKELLKEVLELRGNKDREEAEGSNEEETEERIDRKVAELMSALKREEEGRREERKKEIQSLREERAEEERMLWKVNLERQGLHEEHRKLKRRLFAMARDCAHNQAALNTQRREVEFLKREEEKLQSLVLQLTEEGSQLRVAQQQQLLALQAELHAQRSSQTSNTQDELTQCRRHSCGDIQQYLQGGLKALEDRYEPILLTLLKRREATAGALVKVKEQAKELKAQLRPLKEEIQKLNLQRACLEEKLKLICLQRREDVGQYKETVYCLEDRSRELKTELKIQKRKTKEIEDLRDSLTEQLLIFRAAIKDHNSCGNEEKT